MAKLYGRSHRLPHRGLILALAVASAAMGVLAARDAFSQAAPRLPASEPARPASDEASAESNAELESILSRLRTESPRARRAAVDQVLALDAGDLPAVRRRLLSPLPLSPLAVHAALVRAIHAATGGRENAEYDLLDALVQATPRSPETVLATERIALARAVGRMQTSEAGRVLVAFALDHQKIFRMETTRIIRNTLRDYVLPALIEFRRPNDDARMFIRQLREMLHRVTPGESVQTRDNALLAEILRAYGSIRQSDAMNVAISFVNSDRAQVREAARWAVAQYGRDAINALRQAYENYVGEDANPQWGWERIARELYQANDRRRSDEVTHALDDGLAAGRERRYEDMMPRFEFVLAHHPLYERRSEMVAPLMAYAHALEGHDAAHAETVYRLALRVDPNGASAPVAHGAILYLEAERALARGVADPELYRAALRVDPANRRAQAQLEAVAQVEVLRARKRRRTLIAMGLLALGLAGFGMLLARVRRSGGGSAGDSNRPTVANTKPASA